MIKDFDWEEAKKHNCPDSLAFLKENQNKPFTEEEFVKGICSLPHDHPRKNGTNAPSNRKKQYRSLKEKFGFFL